MLRFVAEEYLELFYQYFSENQFEMDLLVEAFDHVAINIFVRLDDKSLANCRRVKKTWKKLIDNQKFYFIRQITQCQKKHGSFFKSNKQWQEILQDFDTTQKLLDLKNMSIFLKEFFKLKNPELYDPFEWIVSRNQIPWVKFLLRFVNDLNQWTDIGSELEFESNEKVDDDARTPLHTACINGSTEIVKLLFEAKDKKINFNYVDSIGQTPFIIACNNGEYEIVKLFLKYAEEYKIKLNYLDGHFHWSGFTHAVMSKQDGVLDLLLQDERIGQVSHQHMLFEY